MMFVFVPVLFGLYFTFIDPPTIYEHRKRRNPFCKPIAAFAAYLKSWLKTMLVDPMVKQVYTWTTTRP